MKRSLLFLAAAAISISFVACEGPEGPVGPAGQDGQDGRDAQGPGWYSTSITVRESDWILYGGEPGDLNTYFYAYKPINQMNRDIYRNGSVIAYIEAKEGVKNGMPFVLHMGSESEGKEFLWTQTYDFDFDEKGVGFFVTYSDFNTQDRPGEETFHVVLMW